MDSGTGGTGPRGGKGRRRSYGSFLVVEEDVGKLLSRPSPCSTPESAIRRWGFQGGLQLPRNRRGNKPGVSVRIADVSESGETAGEAHMRDGYVLAEAGDPCTVQRGIIARPARCI